MEHRPQCFVLMPFGKQSDPSGTVCDFDQIYTSLIAPAIQAAGIEPLRWDDLATPGSIRRLVLERLMESDYVIADISSGSRNVFYELGIRHALRPSTTVLIARQGANIAFDLAEMRIYFYRLNESGRAEDATAFTRTMAALLAPSPQRPADSPVYLNLNLEPPRLNRRGPAESTVAPLRGLSGLDWKRRITEARYDGIDELRSLEAEMSDVSPEVLLELFKAYRSVSGWKEMIELTAKMPSALTSSPMVQEQLAFALNRTGQPERAEGVLLDLMSRNGPSSETFGILGRVYKDRWQNALQKTDPAAPRFLDRSIEAYVKGFEEDWRDYYPGINAITLMEYRESPDPRREEMIPVVRYAVQRKLAKGKVDYWDLATLLELEVLASNAGAAHEISARIRSIPADSWQKESTARNLTLIREARSKKGIESSWIQEIEKAIASA